MRARRFALAAGLILAALAALTPPLARASLGESESSIEADGVKLQSSDKASDHGLYRVHELQTIGGTLVREYAGLDGSVFAITWQGRFMPNLRQTLGRYFDDYVAAAQANHANHRHLVIRQGDLVVQSDGRPRAFQGRAYLPNAVPTGVSVRDLP